MAGDKGGIARQIYAGLRFKDPHGGERDRHQRRLCVLRERERLRRPVPDHLAEPFAERRVDFLEHLTRRRKAFGQALAHADRLAALARKNERNRHYDLPR